MFKASYYLAALVLGTLFACVPPQDTVSVKKPRKDIARTGSHDKNCDQVLLLPTPGKPFALPELKDRFLATHNAVRRIYGLDDLEWDDQIARYAQDWADHLKATNQCKMLHRYEANMKLGKEYGENLAWNKTNIIIPAGVYRSTPEEANFGFSSECKDYDYDTNTCKPGKMCGHFTQVVWRDTQRVGCGVATCNQGDGNYSGTGRAEIWVCNYDPGGNVTMIENGRKTKLKPY